MPANLVKSVQDKCDMSKEEAEKNEIRLNKKLLMKDIVKSMIISPKFLNIW